MKLSLIFELLLIFVLLAFAASKNITTEATEASNINTNRNKNNKKSVQKGNDDIKVEDNSINKYCKCSESLCNCCRDFAVPVVNLNGPGCASLMYLNGDKMAVSLSFGRKVITNKTLSSRKPSPVCMPLPGGISKFCGRVYNIARLGEEFRACLGLELQAKSSVEAAVRVSCFKFGPRGVTSEPADPLPLVPQDEKVTDEDDDDDDEDEDDFGLGADDDDDDEEEDDDDDDDDGGLGAVNDVESADYTGFSLLGEDILGDLFGSSGSKKPNKGQNKRVPSTTTTTTTTTTTKRPRTKRPTKVNNIRTTTPKSKPSTSRIRTTRKPNRRPSRKPTVQSTVSVESSTSSTILSAASSINSENIKPEVPVINQNIQETESHVMSVIPILDKMPSTVSVTTPKTETTFQDSGLEMSLAHITGQLSLMPVTQIIPTQVKVSTVLTTLPEQINYEKLETITPKPHSLIPFATTVEESNNEDMVQIVSSLDSQSEEHESDKENVTDETRGHKHENEAEAASHEQLPKKKNKGGPFHFEDLDVLDLTGIGESVGHQLGIFGRHKRQNKNKVPKPHNLQGNSDYEDVFGLESLSDSMGLPDLDDIARKDRRKNKMMRGLWS